MAALQRWSFFIGYVHLSIVVGNGEMNEISGITRMAYNATSCYKCPWQDRRTKELHETRCSQPQPEWRRIQAR